MHNNDTVAKASMFSSNLTGYKNVTRVGRSYLASFYHNGEVYKDKFTTLYEAANFVFEARCKVFNIPKESISATTLAHLSKELCEKRHIELNRPRGRRRLPTQPPPLPQVIIDKQNKIEASLTSNSGISDSYLSFLEKRIANLETIISDLVRRNLK